MSVHSGQLIALVLVSIGPIRFAVIGRRRSTFPRTHRYATYRKSAIGCRQQTLANTSPSLNELVISESLLTASCPYTAPRVQDACPWTQSASHLQGREMVHQSLAGVAPPYLADVCRLLSDVGRRTLRLTSNDIRTFVVPRTLNRLGHPIDKLSSADPILWKGLPSSLRQPDLAFLAFRQHLKTTLFCLTEAHSD